jgi:hypothetical protein
LTFNSITPRWFPIKNYNVTSWLKSLDKRAFLGFDFWEFSLRSLTHAYGWFFLRRVALRHPLRTLRGLRAYRRDIRPARNRLLVPVGFASEEAFLAQAKEGPWLLAIGFCEKPLDPPCPAGRFNHECWWLRDVPSHRPMTPCRDCRLRELGEKALAAGATLHVMTSAMDIARDLLLPGLAGTPWKGLLFSVCPYSVGPITLAMSLCGLSGFVASYETGDCRDYAAWIRADVGIKPERTFRSCASHRRLLGLISTIAAARQTKASTPATRFRQEGHFFRPV